MLKRAERWRVAVLAGLAVTMAVPAGAVDWTAMPKARAELKPDDPAIVRILAKADQALSAGPWSVTTKPALAPSHDPKDYVSFAPYFWPDPSKPNGLPYIEHDGQVNPDSRTRADRTKLEDELTAVRNLSLAAYLTGRPRYAQRAGLLLRAFFTDPKTGMNPNLNYAQGIPGKVEGRGFGIIDFNSFPETLDAIKLMGSTATEDGWPAKDRAAFHAWCSAFSDWMRTSRNGREESSAANNHGAWFDATASAFADFAGQPERVRELVERSRRRIELQIKPDGSLPLEMRRTKSWHYSIFALTAFAITAERGRRAGIDLWHDRPSASAGSLSAAVGRLLDHSEGKPWPKADIGGMEDPTPFYRQVRSLLDRPDDADLRRRIDAVLSAPGVQHDDPDVVTFYGR